MQKIGHRLLLTGLFAVGSVWAEEQKFTPGQLEFFEKKIRPLFATHCAECHGGAEKKLYGIDDPDHTEADNFGRACLMARRFAEAGVRFIQLNHGFWDHHRDLEKGMTQHCLETERPIAGLLTDLKQRGLLDDTLELWGGEFGRPPILNKTLGRDHNARGFTMWMAGGGVKGGLRHGATDETGMTATVDKVHLHDIHATLLHLIGLDHEKLTYRYGGRDFRLTDVHGRVVKEILA